MGPTSLVRWVACPNGLAGEDPLKDASPAWSQEDLTRGDMKKHQRLERPGARPGGARGGGPPARALPARRRSYFKPGSPERECRRKQERLSAALKRKLHARVGFGTANVHSAVNCMTLGERAVGSPPNTSHLQTVRQRRRTAACTSSRMLTMESMRNSWYRTALSNTEES